MLDGPLPLPIGGEDDYAYLGLLARVKTALDKAIEVSIPATSIARFVKQPRTYFDPDALRRLSQSMDAGGQTTSGMVRLKAGTTEYYMVDNGRELLLESRPGKTTHELIDGERRWRGVLLIPKESRPLYRAKQIDADDDVIQYLISGIANFNREGHTPLEMMNTIDQHVAFGFPMAQIAILLGISEFWVRQIYGLKNLHPDLAKLLDPKLPKKEQLPVSAAIQISKIEPDLQLGIARRVLTKEVTIGSLRGEVIKVAEQYDSPIRLREVGPKKKWESLGNKVRLIERTVSDARLIVEGGMVNSHVRNDSRQTEVLLKSIENSKRLLEDVELQLRRLQK